MNTFVVWGTLPLTSVSTSPLCKAEVQSGNGGTYRTGSICISTVDEVEAETTQHGSSVRQLFETLPLAS